MEKHYTIDISTAARAENGWNGHSYNMEELSGFDRDPIVADTEQDAIEIFIDILCTEWAEDQDFDLEMDEEKITLYTTGSDRKIEDVIYRKYIEARPWEVWVPKRSTGRFYPIEVPFKFDAAVAAMDKEILSSQFPDVDPDELRTWKECANFLKAYCAAHFEKFGVDFDETLENAAEERAAMEAQASSEVGFGMEME